MPKKTVLFAHIFLLAILVYINLFVVSVVNVRGTSMMPTLSDGDLAFVLKGQDIQQGDVILFRGAEREYLIKRVVGVEGDHIVIKSNELFVNSILIDNKVNSSLDNYREVVYVPAGAIFVLGDNRLESYDSRDFGSIPQNVVIGEVVVP